MTRDPWSATSWDMVGIFLKHRILFQLRVAVIHNNTFQRRKGLENGMSTIRDEHPMSWADHHSPVGQESSFLATVDRYGVSSGTQRLVKCDHCDRIERWSELMSVLGKFISNASTCNLYCPTMSSVWILWYLVVRFPGDRWILFPQIWKFRNQCRLSLDLNTDKYFGF